MSSPRALQCSLIDGKRWRSHLNEHHEDNNSVCQDLNSLGAQPDPPKDPFLSPLPYPMIKLLTPKTTPHSGSTRQLTRDPGGRCRGRRAWRWWRPSRSRSCATPHPAVPARPRGGNASRTPRPSRSADAHPHRAAPPGESITTSGSADITPIPEFPNRIMTNNIATHNVHHNKNMLQEPTGSQSFLLVSCHLTVSRKDRSPGRKRVVGWNCTNSMFCRLAPARNAIANPSPLWNTANTRTNISSRHLLKCICVFMSSEAGMCDHP
jgi:hypothetical protein